MDNVVLDGDSSRKGSQVPNRPDYQSLYVAPLEKPVVKVTGAQTQSPQSSKSQRQKTEEDSSRVVVHSR